MARMPGAIWKPLAADWASQPRMRAFDVVAIHTMVGGLEGTDQQFRVVNGPGFVGTESHFGTGADGRIVQWQDTAYQAEANYNGNHHIISIENADWGAPFPAWSGSDVPALTAAQVEANAQICAWANRTHGIPLELIPDSKPGRRGIAPHRWGVPGYVVAGGELWSTANRKACPGDRRIAQIPQIIARARQIVNGDDDMPTLDEIGRLVDEKLRPIYDTLTPGKAGVKTDGDIYRMVRDTPAAVWAATLPDPDRDVREGTTGSTTPAGTFLVAGAGAATAANSQVQAAVTAQDPEALATALKDVLGEQLAADVAARLTVSAKPNSA